MSENIYCHCYPVFGCHAATSEVEGPDIWYPVCERCMGLAFDLGLRVRKLQRSNFVQAGQNHGPIGLPSKIEHGD